MLMPPRCRAIADAILRADAADDAARYYAQDADADMPP